VKVEQQFSFAFLDNMVISRSGFLDYKIISLLLLRRGGYGNCCDCLQFFNSRGASVHSEPRCVEETRVELARKSCLGARRRRSGGGPGEGCARTPVGAWRSLAVASPTRAFSLPWGRGMMLRRTEVGRSRRSGTVWRRRSLGSSGTGGFLGKYSRIHHL
jgi:hypothetical protein